MNLRIILFNSIILISCMFLAADVTSLAMRSRHILDIELFSRDAAVSEISFGEACSDTPKIKDLSKSAHPGLRRLAEYQSVCQSAVTKTLMVFTDMPKDSNEAKNKAKEMAATLREFSKYGVRPLVIVEPVTSWGFIDFAEFKDGFYDSWLKDYFVALKAEGIADEQMGTWVPFPEANLPYWNHQSVKPEDFGRVVNAYIRIMKKQFPNARASILLNSASYDNNDFEWSNEEYVSLLPYVRTIDKDLIDSFGMQGFPWAGRAGSNYPNQFEASRFLSADIAAEAAQFLDVDDIWLNTASFMQKYTLDERAVVEVSPETRQAIMTGVRDEAKKLQDLGFKVSVNLFAQDKSESSEETNWSYWAPGQQNTSQHSLVFRDFAANLQARGIELWLFDQ